ncbi:MAG TPA: NAD(P)-dependent oxidoreductase [Alphaproteobacteria bacterium]|nr:NAD(P)-dependent oxidoreductase [Alphaproteobacteria bacterium]
MLPVSLDLRRLPLLLVGNGPKTLGRLAQFREAGAPDPAVFAPEPAAELAEAAGPLLRRRLPTAVEIAAARILFVVDLPPQQAAPLAAAARAAGTLVNVEDDLPHCDFHMPATVRRGDLTIAIGTNGKSPGLAAKLRRWLEARFTLEWADRLDELAEARRLWRAEGADMKTVLKRTDDLIDRKGWLE